MTFSTLAEFVDTLNRILGEHLSLNSLTHLQIALRTGLIYLLGIAVIRFGKGRLLGRMTPLDFILGVVLGALFCQGIIGSLSLARTSIAALTLVVLHWLATWVACRSHLFGNLVKGQAIILVQNGIPNIVNMRRAHISDHDLIEELRLKANVDDLKQVRVAYQERSGEIGVVLREKCQ